MQERLNQMDTEIEDMRGILMGTLEITSRNASAIERNTQQIDRLTERVDQLTSVVTNQGERLDRLIQIASGQEQRMSSLEAAVVSLVGAVDRLTQQVNSLAQRAEEDRATIREILNYLFNRHQGNGRE